MTRLSKFFFISLLWVFLTGSPSTALDLSERMEAQALISALGQPIAIDGAIGPMSRLAASKVFEERGRNFSGTIDDRTLADLRLMFFSGKSYKPYPTQEVSTGSYSIPTSYQHCGEDVSTEIFEAADLNGDGYEDIVVFTRKFAKKDGLVRLARDNVSDFIVKPRVLLWSSEANRYRLDEAFSDGIAPTFWPRVVFFEDFDGDGWDDMFARSRRAKSRAFAPDRGAHARSRSRPKR